MSEAHVNSLADPVRGERRLHVIRGEHFVSSDPAVVLVTVLGSCVAACIRDPIAGVGGMNHFLLPGSSENRRVGISHGVHAMELLVNDLLRHGARRDRLEAKLFGGARMVEGLTDVGAQNAAFAERFLKDEGIPCLGGSLRGEHARRVQFWPASGRGRQLLLGVNAEVFDSERTPAAAPLAAPQDSGALELF
jgi:chemotaxis protein CheD